MQIGENQQSQELYQQNFTAQEQHWKNVVTCLREDFRNQIESADKALEAQRIAFQEREEFLHTLHDMKMRETCMVAEVRPCTKYLPQF